MGDYPSTLDEAVSETATRLREAFEKKGRKKFSEQAADFGHRWGFRLTGAGKARVWVDMPIGRVEFDIDEALLHR